MKARWCVTSFLFVAVFLSSGVATAESDEPRYAQLVYSSNLDGELEPCGCSEFGNQGGIKRRVSKIDALRVANPDLFLVSAGGLLISDLPQDRLTSDYILRGFAALNYDAVGVQWQDLAFGVAFLQSHHLPWVASNWHGEAFAAEKQIQHGDVRLNYFQWLDPAQAPQSEMQGGHLPVTADVAELAERLNVARRQGDVTLLATTLSLADAQQQLPLNDVSILMIESNYELYVDPRLVDGMLVLQPGSRGMRLASINLEIDKMGRIITWQHEVMPLPPVVGDAPRMADWYNAYNAEVKAAYKKSVALRKAQKSGESPFAGAQACKSCHQAEYKRWSKSRHSDAFYTLQDVNKAFDPNCISCHTVGFNRDGGFIDPDSTPALLHVQCESCHGAARAHVTSAGRTPPESAGKVKAERCLQCHNATHSPLFKVEDYWPKISH